MYKISYIGDGQTNEFVFDFPFFQNADIHVAVDNVVLNSDEYDINPNEDFDGGIVILNKIPENESRIDIFRHISLNRIIDYQPTMKIDPESLNNDFNFLLAALQDFDGVNIDLSQWKNIHDTVLNQMNYVMETIKDKMSGGAVLGLYNNLLNVLDGALPKLINDYGSVTEVAPYETRDDYGSI
ncbi:MAG: hypothetical protein IJV03_04035 [Alphaproteobacteria bacterium]|nr:hypothetical protein [Alphaproteobacteria bacterium]